MALCHEDYKVLCLGDFMALCHKELNKLALGLGVPFKGAMVWYLSCILPCIVLILMLSMLMYDG